MLNLIKRCGLIFLFIFIYKSYVFCKQEVSLELEPIIISKADIHLLDVYSLKQDYIKKLPFVSFIEALSLSPLDLQSRNLYSGIQTDFSLRGSGFCGVLILMDSMRINDPQTAHHNSDIPLTKEDVQKIEIIPGLGSSLFGPDAIGGAINIVRKKPLENKKILELGLGSYKTKSTIFSISQAKEDMGLRFSLERDESAGFYYDTDFKNFIGRFDLYRDLDLGEFDLGLGYQEKEFGAYDFYTPGRGYPSKEWTKTICLNTGLNFDIDNFFINFIKPNFLWRRHFDKFTLDKNRIGWYLNHHRTDIYTPQIYFQKEDFLWGKLGLGWEYGQEAINSTRLGKHRRSHQSLFLDYSKELIKDISSGFSLRWDDFDIFGDNYTGSTSIKVRLNTWNSLFFGIWRSIRIPSFTELYYIDPVTEGSPDLSVEKALTYQIGYSYKKDIVTTGVVFFFRKEKDFIEWVSSGTVPLGRWQAKNITETEVFGVESHFSLKTERLPDLNTHYTYIDKNRDNRGYIYKYGPNYIQHLVNVSFSLDFLFGEPFFGFVYKKRPRRHGWFLGSFGFQRRIGRDYLMFLKINNLFNVEYQEIEGVPQPSRSFTLGLRREW